MANVPPAVDVLKKNLVSVHRDEAAASQAALGQAEKTRLEAFKKELASGMESKI
ncbi:hypothetical protein BGZ72_000883, partial [Mortierella alpina]